MKGRNVLKASLLALTIATASAPAAYAFSGAELVAMPGVYQTGFVWGSANVFMSAGGTPDSERLSRHRTLCLYNAQITDGTLTRSVLKHIENTPEALAQPAVLAVNAVLNRMCGAPGQSRR